MGRLSILGPGGDVKVTWDPAISDEVDHVRRRFDEIVSQGYLVFELDEQTREGRRVSEFDPGSKELRAFRPMVGGSSR